MNERRKGYRSKGDGRFERSELGACGANTVIEDGVRIIHPARVFIGDGVYIGHDAMLEAYHEREMHIGEGTWIGAGCFFHAAGGIRIGKNVGIGPQVRILTSRHMEAGRATPILHSPLEFGEVVIGDDSDIGVGAILMPGVTIGVGVQVGAGALVSSDAPRYSVVAGVPAKVLRMRPPLSLVPPALHSNEDDDEP